ncbi:MAG: hypothetical protein IPK82_21410 [Polyangiaceae bacterium]|nr:hypothetical protein [Polyangiaceae bacterium]
MAIQNTMELEAIVTRVILRLDKAIQEKGTWPVIEDARRTLEQMRAVTRQSAKLKAMREKLRGAAETIISELSNDAAVHEDVWDIEDFVDYRA